MSDKCIGNCIICGKCGNFNILDAFQPGGQAFEPRKGYGIAADIGTTSVVLAMLDLATGKVAARHSFINPQRAYGPDVISRIHAANEGHLSELSRLITDSVADGISALCKSRGAGRIEEIVISGNATMAHLLLCQPCGSLGVFPFKPVYRMESGYTLFGRPARVIPWLSAFVGGDVTAGLLYVITHRRKRFMLLDLGTNGEMALYNNGKLTVTSAAAGPSFERGHGGASGVISELARLVRTGAVDETGLLAGESVFTQKDIRDLQLAKSAVRSGLEILLETAGIAYDALDAIYLAGGIGQAMDIDDAADIGLIPPGLRRKTRAMGNTSLGGAALLLASPSETDKAMQALLSGFTEINLAEHPRFNDLFMENMSF